MSYPFPYDPPAAADEGDESAIQVALKRKIKMVAPSAAVVAIPNAGQRTAWAAMNAKREGMAKGFPDLEVIWTGGHAYIELKCRKGTLAPEQIDWLNRLHRMGHPCGCFRSVSTALAFLKAQGAPVHD